VYAPTTNEPRSFRPGGRRLGPDRGPPFPLFAGVRCGGLIEKLEQSGARKCDRKDRAGEFGPARRSAVQGLLSRSMRGQRNAVHCRIGAAPQVECGLQERKAPASGLLHRGQGDDPYRAAADVDGPRGAEAHIGSISPLTIQGVPNLSVSMPKLFAQKVGAIGMVTLPPTESLSKTFCASPVVS
jgi:hypothetical protein